ncbi:tectonic-3-like [Exaiptasia diaphana]|uniref:Tectonic-1-3 N-terminal domain-containing protein n=1 Tax=Exaiptasia diaphana TaxID=2652724 RepID=A0A913YU29_EXADI|nr:tectonic-3-like [Exaiptasia diaphana]
MAAKLFCKFLFILLFYDPSDAADSNRTAFSPSSSQGCTCDLTGNSCDTNCCCDPDCSSTEKEAFTECKDADVNQDNKVCVSNDLLFIQNTQFKTQATGTGLFCIFRDNYSSRNYYNDITSASSDTEFSNLKRQSSKSIYINQGLQQTQPSASSYKVNMTSPYRQQGSKYRSVKGQCPSKFPRSPAKSSF